MNYKHVKQYVTGLLGGLDARLSYHGKSHTLNDVLPAAILMSRQFGLKESDEILLKTAVLFHDVGYLIQSDNNEAIGADIAQMGLPEYGYDEAQITVITELIMVTAMPQQPKTLMQKIICDADLDSLWRPDFLEVSQGLLKELNSLGGNISERNWWLRQVEFLKNHNYFCHDKENLKRKGKQRNIEALKYLTE